MWDRRRNPVTIKTSIAVSILLFMASHMTAKRHTITSRSHHLPCFLTSPAGPRCGRTRRVKDGNRAQLEVCRAVSIVRRIGSAGGHQGGRCEYCHRKPRTRATGEGRSYGEIRGSGVEHRYHDSKSQTAAKDEKADDRGSEKDLETMGSGAAVRKQKKAALRDITHPLDLLYAVMPEVQGGSARGVLTGYAEKLRDATGQDGGFGAGYEDAPLGFYRDSNLKPTNWRDAVVSMKPGSGTTRLVHKASLDTTPTWKDLGYDAIADLLEEAVQEALSEEEKSDGDSSFELHPSAASNHEFEKARPAAEAPSSYPREPRKEALFRVGTRYGGPPPGEHGPWRWGQLEPGSPREKELTAEIASFPRRLSRRLRRYFHGKVVWVTGADRDLGERVAINLTVNGAKVILSGMSLVELERVQRLCILAWMKAVDWEISKAVAKRLTRLDRTLVIPLDVRDDFILPDAARNAEEMLGSPIDMVFHCAGTPVMRGRPSLSESDIAATKRKREVMEAFLWGAVGLTKAVLPSMLDRQQGHIVVLTGEGSYFTPQGEQSVEATPRHAALGYFDSLRAEFSRDRIKVTIAHPGITKPASTPLRDGERRVSPPSKDGLSRAKETDKVVRRLLTGVARGEHEIVFENRESRGLDPFWREWMMRLARLRAR